MPLLLVLAFAVPAIRRSGRGRRALRRRPVGRDLQPGTRAPDGDPPNNNASQRDTLRGGAGDAWISPSHGRTRVVAGPGNDRVWACYGRGTIDCGPGRDTVRVRLNGAVRLERCEVVNHLCAHGSDGRGGCLKPGGKRRS